MNESFQVFFFCMVLCTMSGAVLRMEQDEQPETPHGLSKKLIAWSK